METKKKTVAKKKVVAAPKKVVAKKTVKKVSKTTAATRTVKKAQLSRPVAKSTASKKVVAIKKVKKTKTVAAVKKQHKETKTGQHKESGLKHLAYLLFSIILGLLIATAAHLFVELVYLKKITLETQILQSHNFLGATTFLPVWVSGLFLLGGLAFGFKFGSWGWNIVYVQRKHRMFRKA